jgi:hypothetical protein
VNEVIWVVLVMFPLTSIPPVKVALHRGTIVARAGETVNNGATSAAQRNESSRLIIRIPFLSGKDPHRTRQALPRSSTCAATSLPEAHFTPIPKHAARTTTYEWDDVPGSRLEKTISVIVEGAFPSQTTVPAGRHPGLGSKFRIRYPSGDFRLLLQ